MENTERYQLNKQLAQTVNNAVEDLPDELRLALMLRAAELSPAAIERQMLLIEPMGRLPRGFGGVSSERAAVLLGSGGL